VLIHHPLLCQVLNADNLREYKQEIV